MPVVPGGSATFDFDGLGVIEVTANRHGAIRRLAGASLTDVSAATVFGQSSLQALFEFLATPAGSTARLSEPC